jgi:hypothetical protein
MVSIHIHIHIVNTSSALRFPLEKRELSTKNMEFLQNNVGNTFAANCLDDNYYIILENGYLINKANAILVEDKKINQQPLVSNISIDLTLALASLYNLYGRFLEICSTKKYSTPWKGVRYYYCNRNVAFRQHPEFTGPPQYYQIAIEIVEDRPVFVGDFLYNKLGEILEVKAITKLGYLKTVNVETTHTEPPYLVEYSPINLYWEQPKLKVADDPKKTLVSSTLFGKDFPMPSRHPPKDCLWFCINLGGTFYYWKNKTDCDKALETLNNIFQGKPL